MIGLNVVVMGSSFEKQARPGFDTGYQWLVCEWSLFTPLPLLCWLLLLSTYTSQPESLGTPKPPFVGESVSRSEILSVRSMPCFVRSLSRIREFERHRVSYQTHWALEHVKNFSCLRYWSFPPK